MKRWIIYTAAVALLLLLPKERRTDISNLAPAEVIYIYILTLLHLKSKYLG